MDWDAIGLNWERLTPLAQAQFTGVSEEDMRSAKGNRDALNRAIAKANGITEQEAAHQTQEWALKLEADEKDVQPRTRAAARSGALGSPFQDAPRTARTEQGVNPPPPADKPT